MNSIKWPVLYINFLSKNMLNDKGFSRIISLIIVIVIVILIGVVIFINSVGDNDSIDFVNIIENELINSTKESVSENVEFVGLDISAGGYKVLNMVQNTKSTEVIYEEVSGKYNLLTKTVNQDSILVVKDFWQDKDAGGKVILQMQVETGDLTKVLELPNTRVGDFARFITSAVYSPDNNFIAYSTYVYDLEIVDGVGKEGPEYVEIWEYDITKDIHTLVTQIDGGLYVGVDLVGYDSEKKYLIVYQYLGDGPGMSFGTTYFINLADQSIDKNILRTAVDRFTKQDREGEKNTLPLGIPHLSPSGEYIAFLLPVGLYYGGEVDVATPVILYNIRSNEFSDLYQYDLFKLGNTIQDWQEVFNIHWQQQKLYIATNKQVLEYNLVTTKLRPLYEWTRGTQDRYSVLSIDDNDLMIKGNSDGVVIYVDYSEAIEYELADFQNFEYVNIYYK